MSARPLARLAVSLLLVAGLVALTGCFKSNEVVKVRKDGSGSATVAMTIDMSQIEALKEMLAGMGMGGEGQGPMVTDPLEDLDPEKLKKQFEGKKGIKLVSVKRVHDEEKKTVTVTMELKFDSIEALYRSGQMKNVSIKLEKNDDGSYTLTRDVGGDMMPDMGDSPEADEMLAPMLAMFEPVLKDMQASAAMTLPTAIIETNGEKVGTNQVKWNVGFKDISKSDKRKQVVKFSGEGLNWKPFALKASDMEAEAEIEAPPIPEEEEVDEKEPK